MSEPLRVVLVGREADVEDWARVLSSRPIEMVRAADLESVLRAQPDLAVVAASHEQGLQLGSALAAASPPPAVVLLLGEGLHPHTRLMKAMAQAKQEWEAAFDAIVDPVLILDDQGVVTRANLAVAQALGLRIAEVVGRAYVELLGGALEGADPVAESLVRWRPQTSEARYERLPGLRLVTTSPLAPGAAQRPGLVAILKDVSELKEQRERLLQTARLADIGQLAAGVAHEINTPLASIALRAESLRKAAEDPRLQAIDSFRNFPRYLATIEEEIFRCKKIISALLEFSRVRRPEVREVDLGALCEKAADLVSHQMRLKQVSLQLRLEPGPLLIKGDDGQLRQVLIALLVNALDATGAGGTIVIETLREPEGAVQLVVSDDGVGIPAEHLDRIFSPFFTTKPPGKGTGLGLAICHGVMAAHGGEIRIESEPGRGTKVALLFPPPTPSAATLREPEVS